MENRKTLVIREIDSLDILFITLFSIALFVPDIGDSFGVPKRYLWVPTLVFFFWVLYIGFFRAKVSFSFSFELSLLERIRGWTYGTSLAVTFLCNALAVTQLVTPYVIIPLVGLLLIPAVLGVPRVFFEKYWKLFTPIQKKDCMLVLREVSIVSIWLSITILIVQTSAFGGGLLGSFIIDCIFLVLFLARIVSAEMKSRDLAKKLADSLQESRLQQRLKNMGKAKQKKEKSQRKKS